ncbi:MAG TPA: NRAMP family divalent metal transporter [Gemmatimonadales bacterium]|nr:NRAMP family divalent metal transporter [Gemmatimonadales bacterium]
MTTTPPDGQRSGRLRVLLGAAFLMATSAIGPGFLTQTVVFTAALGASFGFAILVSVLFDLGAQLTVWRMVVASGLPAQALADRVLPGLGRLLIVLVAIGGLAFNIGNVAGAGLGLDALLGLDPRLGAALSAVIAIGIFLVKEAGRAMDRFAQLMGGVMVLLALYVAVAAAPPLGEALIRTFAPTRLDALSIVTIVGGTVGGYITFAGAHRLLDAGIVGPGSIGLATRSAVLGIGIASLMRVVLFLAALGVVSQGLRLDPANPPASVFRHAAGALGYRLFGAVMWAAAITSVVGSAYTSVSFVRTLLPPERRADPRSTSAMIVGFIVVSTAIFLAVGRPVTILIAVGALNAFVLPIGLGAMLLASRRADLMQGYRHPPLLAAAGGTVALLMAALGVYTIVTQF